MRISTVLTFVGRSKRFEPQDCFCLWYIRWSSFYSKFYFHPFLISRLFFPVNSPKRISRSENLRLLSPGNIFRDIVLETKKKCFENPSRSKSQIFQNDSPTAEFPNKLTFPIKIGNKKLTFLMSLSTVFVISL